MRTDNFFTTVGDRPDIGMKRIWVEDSFGRLSRNGFTAGTPYSVTTRPGLGLLVQPAAVSSLHVSSRRSASILSYESSRLAQSITTNEARVKVSVGSIIILPALRLFHVARTASNWSIAGMMLTRPEGVSGIATERPVRYPFSPDSLTVALDETNLIFALEIVGNAKPGEVAVNGEPLLRQIAGQFLAEAGYSLKSPDVWAR